MSYIKENNLKQYVISHLMGNPVEYNSSLNIMPLDSQVKPENDRESGRSMVEMLGVLAIIGVLSVAGIAGYSNAMRAHRANEIVHAVSILYVTGIASDAGEGTADINYEDIGTLPKGISALSYVGDTKSVSMVIDDADDCIMVKNKLGDKITGECTNLTVTFGDEAQIDEEPETACPENFDTHNGCQSCENGIITYASEGKTCINGNGTSDYSACDGNGNCNACPNWSAPLDQYNSHGDATSVPGCYCLSSDPDWYNGRCND